MHHDQHGMMRLCQWRVRPAPHKQHLIHLLHSFLSSISAAFSVLTAMHVFMCHKDQAMHNRQCQHFCTCVSCLVLAYYGKGTHSLQWPGMAVLSWCMVRGTYHSVHSKQILRLHDTRLHVAVADVLLHMTGLASACKKKSDWACTAVTHIGI